MTKKAGKQAKKTCLTGNKETRDEKGRFRKGVSGNLKGRPKDGSDWKSKLEVSLNKQGENVGKTFTDHIAERAYKNDQVLIAVLRKLAPDLRAVEGDVKHSVTWADLIVQLKNARIK